MPARYRPPVLPSRPDWLVRAGMCWVVWWQMPIGGRWGLAAALGLAGYCVLRAIRDR